MGRKKRANPFYVVLVVVGVAFAITACAYGVMAVKELHAGTNFSEYDDAAADGYDATDMRFVEFMDRNGVRIMIWEIGILAVATFLSIGTDRFWSGEE